MWEFQFFPFSPTLDMIRLLNVSHSPRWFLFVIFTYVSLVTKDSSTFSIWIFSWSACSDILTIFYLSACFFLIYLQNFFIYYTMDAYVQAKSLQLCPALCHPMDCNLPDSSWDTPGKNTEVGCHAFLQEISPLHRLNRHLLCLLRW